MKRAWYHFISIFGLTENARERARKRLVKPLFGHPTGVCLGCGVDMFDGSVYASLYNGYPYLLAPSLPHLQPRRKLSFVDPTVD